MTYKDFHGYKISDKGDVIGLYGRSIKARINNGRYEVRLSINGKRKNFLLARLVCYLHKGFDIEDKNLCVIHKDGNRLNINIDNLQVVERKDLIQGEKHKKVSKLTNQQIEEIRDLYRNHKSENQFDKKGYSLNDIAKKYGVTKSNIYHIVSKRSRDKDKYKL